MEHLFTKLVDGKTVFYFLPLSVRVHAKLCIRLIFIVEELSLQQRE
jgi:hypothetical protein